MHITVTKGQISVLLTWAFTKKRGGLNGWKKILFRSRFGTRVFKDM
jgi:hypothetical protein